MPTYKYNCQKCDNTFEVKASLEEKEKNDPKKFKCNNCGSSDLKQDFCGTNISATNHEKGHSGSCGGCCCSH